MGIPYEGYALAIVWDFGEWFDFWIQINKNRILLAIPESDYLLKCRNLYLGA